MGSLAKDEKFTASLLPQFPLVQIGERIKPDQLFIVFDLLSTSNQRLVKTFLQQALSDSTLNEVYVLSTFKLQPKSTAVIFGLYSSTENRKYFEFTVMGRVNKARDKTAEMPSSAVFSLGLTPICMFKQTAYYDTKAAYMPAQIAARLYLRNDGKLHAVIFSNVPLADGKRHTILLRLSGLQRGHSKAELYVDCAQLDSTQELSKAFSGLSQSSEPVELRTLQRKAQDVLEELKLVVRGSLSQVAGLQDCFLPQIEPAVSYPGIYQKKSNYIPGSLQEVLLAFVNKVKETTFLRNTIAECQACGLGAGNFPTPPPQPPKPKCETNTCFRGVLCTDTADGFQCGPCPEGFTGNGIVCTDIDECRYNPCFPGVRCLNMAPGFRCETCPPGYTGQIIQGVGINSAKNNKQVGLHGHR
ncbi:hypothetical protein JD844_008634 [Phrynosoma platyrhinos]|uniref:EGF-like domain-containing protein n=1 Tax=Phrynosoma platyrhinos TaxID=52577 RepID=A0ABQ7TEZ3_PHRPL|nr:hypothetical protein JD844_008634 [Phrynosoma platyrhinos]